MTPTGVQTRYNINEGKTFFIARRLLARLYEHDINI